MPVGIRWPALLPPPLRDEYNTGYEETKKRTDMEVGMARQRRLYRSEPRIEDVTWVMTQAQYRIFDLWWQNDIKKGALLFDIQLRDEVNGLIWYTARWTKTFEATMNSDRYEWRVKAKLRLLGAPFADRPAGTDELGGRASLSLRATGAIQIARVMRGRASFNFSARGRFANGTLYGRTSLGLSARGYIGKPLLGSTTFTLNATGFLDNPLFGAAALGMQNTGLFEVSLLGRADFETQNTGLFEVPLIGRAELDNTNTGVLE